MSNENSHTQEYWQYEYDVSARSMVPLLLEWGVALEGADVIDVGCGEGGGVCSLHDRGARIVGFDIDLDRVEAAKSLQGDRNIPLSVGNLYDEALPFQEKRFDLVVLHDVFEHLDNKEQMLQRLGRYLKPDGKIMITFPPYYSAYGAHQQHLQSTFGRMPFFHLLPWAISGLLPRMKREHPHVIEELQKLWRNKMGMEKFERLVFTAGFSVAAMRAYLISPNHIRFGLKPISAGVVGTIPVLREVCCTGVVYLLARQ